MRVGGTAQPAPPAAEAAKPCIDVQPPSFWEFPTCMSQVAMGKCWERRTNQDGYCEKSCGVCQLAKKKESGKQSQQEERGNADEEHR